MLLSWAVVLLGAVPVHGAKPPASPVVRFLVPSESSDREIEKARKRGQAVVINNDEQCSTSIRYGFPQRFSKFVTHLERIYGFECSDAYLLKDDQFVLDFTEFDGSWGYIARDRLEIFMVDDQVFLTDNFSSFDYDYYYIVINDRDIRSYRCIFDHSRIPSWNSFKVDRKKTNPYPQAILRYLYNGAGMGKDICSDYKEYRRKADEDFQRRLYGEQ